MAVQQGCAFALEKELILHEIFWRRAISETGIFWNYFVASENFLVFRIKFFRVCFLSLSLCLSLWSSASSLFDVLLMDLQYVEFHGPSFVPFERDSSSSSDSEL